MEEFRKKCEQLAKLKEEFRSKYTISESTVPEHLAISSFAVDFPEMFNKSRNNEKE